MFVLTCAAVDYYAAVLPKVKALVAAGVAKTVEALHGRMPQKRRVAVYDRFLAAPSGVLLCTDVAARGVDIPDVDWIVQFDPPTDPALFVHRVGRAARAGRSGSAVCFLTPDEDAYVDFLRLRRVPLEPLAPYAAPADPLPDMRKAAAADRDVLEKGTRAFVSFVRAYKEHHCRFIFRFEKVDLPNAIRAHALLSLPKMPELRAAGVAALMGDEMAAVDTTKVQYADKTREKARKKRNIAAAEVRKEKEAARPARGERGDGAAADRRPEPKKEPEKRKRRGKHEQIMDEWNELQREEMLYKRLRRGKINKAEYERALRGWSDEESGGGSGGESD